MNKQDQFDDYKSIFTDLNNNPEFQKAVEELEPGYQITRHRLLKGLSQSQLAKLAGTTQSSIARLENGSSLPSLSFLKRVAEALGVKVQVLISDENKVNDENEHYVSTSEWPGLSSVIRQAFSASNLDDVAYATDERLFSQWLNQNMGEIFQEIKNHNFSSAIFCLKMIIAQLSSFRMESAIVSDICFICEKQIDLVTQMIEMDIEIKKFNQKTLNFSKLTNKQNSEVLVDDSSDSGYVKETNSIKSSDYLAGG